MSWDATLETTETRTCPHCDGVLEQSVHEVGSWNCTHNINPMIRSAGDPDWWKSLDGLSGTEGKALLERIIMGLEAEPGRFRAMNPENGWGDYDSLLTVLREMRDAVPPEPSTWRMWG